MADLLKESNLRVTDATGGIIVQGASSKTMTVISISLCETAGNAETFSIWRTDLDGSSNVFYIYHTQTLGAKATFIHNDKIVLGATSELWCGSPSASADIDVKVSYLEQDT
tara:strand:- start:431 stop:763 length:333 start_codon:yes stop_codon:yes gene_type:complete